ncbi:MAG: endonuclease NucS [Dehalococcoidia bacterium]
MPVRHAIWRVGSPPEPLVVSSLGRESLLEDMIAADPSILSESWLLIGRQVRTDHGGFIDLLALNVDAQLIVIELKRNQTPREVVAQGLDYASWARQLTPDRLASIYDGFSNGGSLGDRFRDHFGVDLDEEQLNGAHQLVIVASVLDASTERIVNYLNEMDVPVNIIFFQVFSDGPNQYLSRSWLIDPIETETRATPRDSGPKVEWNREYYVSFGHGSSRDWDEAVRYGFISAGGGAWYTKTLRLLTTESTIWVNIPRVGYVGVGRVRGPAVPVNEFFVDADGVRRPFLDVAKADYHRASVGDEDKGEFIVPVEWIATRPLAEAVSEVGFFGNQNTVCRPVTSKWIHTVDRLKHEFIGTAESGETTMLR